METRAAENESLPPRVLLRFDGSILGFLAFAALFFELSYGEDDNPHKVSD